MRSVLWRRKIRLAFFMMSIALAGSLARAQNNEVRSFYRGVRALGMGGAGVAVANDETSLLVNPAGLGRLRNMYGTILDPEVEGSTNWPILYLEKAYSNPLDLENMAPTLAAHPDAPFHAKAQLFPSFVVRNFGIGIFGKQLLDARVDADGNNVQAFYQDDLALLLGFNFRLWGGRIKLGVTGKMISRIELDQNLPLTGPLDYKSTASEGVGMGFDAGLMLTAPIAWLPTLAAVVRDVGSTRFDSMTGMRLSSATTPATVDQDIDVGFSVQPIHSKNTRSVFAAEYKKITAAAAASDKMRHVHIGYEYNYADLLFFRAGMNQRYWTAGFELASEHTQIQFAYFADDIGPDGAPEEDRRWVWKFVFRF